MESVNKDEDRKSRRSSKRVKKLEEEVEKIFSQDETEEDCNARMDKNEIGPKTPSRTNTTKNAPTPRASKVVLQEMLQTPRRSCRKSIKPSQDYEDIINKSLRCTPSSRRACLITEEEEEEHHVSGYEHPKWTPAKVGRVSQKRGRKSKRFAKGKQQDENNPFGEESACDEKDGNTDVDIQEDNKEPLEGIVEQNENMNENDKDTKETSVEESVSTVAEVKSEDFVQTEQTTEIRKSSLLQKEQVCETIGNMEHENLESVYTNVQENKDIEVQPNTGNEIDDNLKDHDASIHLIQDDSDDSQKFAEKSEKEEICIIYENNISSIEIKEESEDETQLLIPKRKSLEEKKVESFGSYLKSKEMNISDLGLNLLKEEEDVKDVNDGNKFSSMHEVEEMPSLIICDDDDEIHDTESNTKMNDTFDAIDSVKVVDEMLENCSNHDDEMEVLQLSDEGGETPRKRIRILLNDNELQNYSIASNSKKSVVKVQLPSTPKVNSTQKQSTKPFRFPTPFRNKKSFKFNKEDGENIINTPGKSMSSATIIPVTTLEPKEVVLRGIRKRSLSVCIDGNDEKRQKFLNGPVKKTKKDLAVSFYSPANESVIIDNIDAIIANSLQKERAQEKKLSNKFVTTRRKRSMSFDESIISTSFASKLPRPPVGQNLAKKAQKSNSTSKPLSRTKLPNFSAIHQKQFQKMENLEEHVNRKLERSKNLINSATKLKPASVQKSGSAIKTISNISTGKPKPVKKIDLENVSQINNSIFHTTSALSEQHETKTMKSIPNAKLGVAKPIKSESISRKTPHHEQQVNKYLKPSQTKNIEKSRLDTKTVPPSKPAFDLSTSIMVKTKASESKFNEKASTSHVANDDKMALRLQRHMDLFKGRAASSRVGVTSRRNDVILKGVRSNRRFELQMQHRRNLEQ